MCADAFFSASRASRFPTASSMSPLPTACWLRIRVREYGKGERTAGVKGRTGTGGIRAGERGGEEDGKRERPQKRWTTGRGALVGSFHEAYAGTAVLGGDSRTQPNAMNPTPTRRLTVANKRRRKVNIHVKMVLFAIVWDSLLSPLLYSPHPHVFESLSTVSEESPGSWFVKKSCFQRNFTTTDHYNPPPRAAL